MAAARTIFSKSGSLRSKLFSDTIRASVSTHQLHDSSKKWISLSSLTLKSTQIRNESKDLHNTTWLKLLNKYSTSAKSDRNCWKCGVSNHSYEELFFCKCGIVQALPDKITYFQMLNSDQQFDIDTERLAHVYKDLQSRLHPDKFSLKSQEEQDLAVKQSSFINKAYFTLLKPLTRGLYLLELLGNPLEESNNTVDQEFLMEMMETNEDIDGAKSDLTELKTLEQINDAKMQDCLQEVSKHFRNKNITEAKSSLIRLKYFTNLNDKIKEIYRNHMDL